MSVDNEDQIPELLAVWRIGPARGQTIVRTPWRHNSLGLHGDTISSTPWRHYSHESISYVMKALDNTRLHRELQLIEQVFLLMPGSLSYRDVRAFCRRRVQAVGRQRPSQ